MRRAQCPLVHLCYDSFKPVCWPAGGQASEEASDGWACRWPLRRPLWWSLSFHGNSGPKCYWIWGRLSVKARNVSAQNHRGAILVFTTPEWSFFIPTDSRIWRLQEWHRVRVWRLWNIQGRLWICRAGKSRDVGWRGKSQNELVHQVSGHVFNCLCQVISNDPHLFICFSSSG